MIFAKFIHYLSETRNPEYIWGLELGTSRTDREPYQILDEVYWVHSYSWVSDTSLRELTSMFKGLGRGCHACFNRPAKKVQLGAGCLSAKKTFQLFDSKNTYPDPKGVFIVEF